MLSDVHGDLLDGREDLACFADGVVEGARLDTATGDAISPATYKTTVRWIERRVW